MKHCPFVELPHICTRQQVLGGECVGSCSAQSKSPQGWSEAAGLMREVRLVAWLRSSFASSLLGRNLELAAYPQLCQRASCVLHRSA